MGQIASHSIEVAVTRTAPCPSQRKCPWFVGPVVGQDKHPTETAWLLPVTFQGRVNKDKQEIIQ